MAMISPSNEAFSETISTLKFATRAKKIKNQAHINEDLDQQALLRKYEMEIKRLRMELDNRQSVTPVNNEVLQDMAEQKRRLEMDRQAAITALEARSREFVKEKEEKELLKARIKMLTSQVLVGGKTIEETP